MLNLICSNRLHLQDKVNPDKNHLLEARLKVLSILKKGLALSRNLLEMTQELLTKKSIKKISRKLLKGPADHRNKRKIWKIKKINKAKSKRKRGHGNMKVLEN